MTSSGNSRERSVSRRVRALLACIWLSLAYGMLPAATEADVETRVAALLEKMTLAEKIGQMTQASNDVITPEEVSELGIGSILSGGNGNPTPNTPEAWIEMVSAFTEAASSTRLGIPLLWEKLRPYQQARIMAFFDPSSDAFGTGYQAIQSQVAIGSGGLFGTHYLQGTQKGLAFLPERHTDFILAVLSEEFGLVGVLVLFAIYLFITGRGLYIASSARSTYARLLAGSLSLTFFVYLFVNVGMVSGILPVVGVPLPLMRLTARAVLPG